MDRRSEEDEARQNGAPEVTPRQLGDLCHWSGVAFLVGAFIATLYEHF
jgi:hypothetical protein